MNLVMMDYDNRMIAIMSDSQRDVYGMEPYNQKKDILRFFQRKSLYVRGNNFMFDFEKNEISVYGDDCYDGAGYNYNKTKRLDSDIMDGLAGQRHEILTVLGFAMDTQDDYNEKYREYAEFIEKHGMPPE